MPDPSALTLSLLGAHREILDNLRDLVIVTDPANRVLYANPALQVLLGIAPADAIGSDATQLAPFAWSSPAAELEATESLVATGEWHGEISVATFDGDERYLDLSITALRDQDGVVTGFASIGRDVTERRSAEAALHAAEARYRNLVEQAPSVTYLDAIAGEPRWIFVSPQILGLVGHSPEQWTGKGKHLWEECLHPDDRERVLLAFGLRDTRGGTWAEEYRLITRAGDTIFVHDTANVILDPHGEPLCWQGTFIDITARRTADHDQAFQARILDQISDAVITTDPERIIMTWNAAAEALYGWNAGEAIGRPIWDVLRSEFLHPVDADALLSYAEEGPSQGELIQYHRNGEALYIEAKGMPLLDEAGKPSGHVTVNRNVTERKDAERAVHAALIAEQAAARASSAKSEFLSRMSHELRTPLNAISGFSQLLAMDDLTTDQRHSTQQIMQGGEHLLNLINEILDISRVEIDQLGLDMTPVALRQALKDASELIRPLADRHGVRVEIVADESIPDSVSADPQRLRQVLLNLLSNAIKYNGHQGLVRVDVEGRADGMIRAWVVDDGPGISEQQAERLFIPFERLGAESSDVEGTGLGLALSQRMVEAMAGQIGCERPREGGCAFWFDLAEAEPLQEAAASILEESLCFDTGLAPTGLVLYVEDNLSNLRLLQQVIARRPGVELIYAMQGQLGFDLAMERHPDLILLDLHLPDVSGAELLARFRLQPGLEDTPIFMVSADATSIQIEGLLNAGADEYLTKPLDIARFLTILDRTLAPTRQAGTLSGALL